MNKLRFISPTQLIPVLFAIVLVFYVLIGSLVAQQSPALKYDKRSGLPIVHAYHGLLLDHEFKEIPQTESNAVKVLAAYSSAMQKSLVANDRERVLSLTGPLRSRGQLDPASSYAAEARLAHQFLGDSNITWRSFDKGTLGAIEVWARQVRKNPEATTLRANPAAFQMLTSAGVEISSPDSAAPQSYIDQCKIQSVPIPPDWGNPLWKKQGVLDKRYVFAARDDQVTEVWAYADPKVPGVCMALPRVREADGSILLLGIICQSRTTGKACFWDNIDRKTELRIEGDAAKQMKIVDLQDGSNLEENCTNCHRGDNVFFIHPGTALDISSKYELQTEKRYSPISGNPNWGNPGPLVKRGKPPCASCHELPGVASSNNTGSVSAYCGVLQAAVDRTMPLIGFPARWNSPHPAYKAHVDFLRGECAKFNQGS